MTYQSAKNRKIKLPGLFFRFFPEIVIHATSLDLIINIMNKTKAFDRLIPGYSGKAGFITQIN